MAPLDLLFHALNFVLPALVVGALVAVAAPFFMKGAISRGRWLQAGINAAAGVAALAGGLWYFGNDGKMASYAAMVVLIATSQWVQHSGWKR